VSPAGRKSRRTVAGAEGHRRRMPDQKASFDTPCHTLKGTICTLAPKDLRM
jgi:hypothetical protein